MSGATSTRVGIVGYRMGNLRSLLNAFAAISVDAFVAETPAELGTATHIILPGVGAFPRGMRNLSEFGFVDIVRRWADAGRPLLGVCLGMQLLGSQGDEHEVTPGLGLVPGRVTALRAGGLRLPHIGWNDTVAARESPLFAPAGAVAIFYYVHGYGLEPENEAHITMTSTYGERFVAGVRRDNVFGVQFHPEKSHAAGLDVLRRFAAFRC